LRNVRQGVKMETNNMVPYGYRMTELGLLPEEWEVVNLKNLNSEKKVNLNPADYPNEIFEYYSIPSYQDFRKPTLEKGINILSQKIILKNEAVLFGKLNPRVEKVWIVRSDLKYRKIGSTEWIPIFPDNEKVDSDYLYYAEWSKYVMNIAKTLVTGSTPSRQRVDLTSFYEITIPLPPLHEQRKIAGVLGAVQGAKEKTEEVIKAAKELKKSLMKHLFTYGPVSIEEADKVKLKETEIGMMPEDWNIVKLGKIFNVKQGKQLSSKESIEGKRKKPFLRTSNIFWGKIDLSKIDSMYFTKIEFDSLILKEGDILLCEGGDIGRTAIWNCEISQCAYQNHLHRLRIKSSQDYDNYFFSYWMQFAITQKRLYIYQGNVTTIPNLSSSRLKNFEIPIFSLHKQRIIADYLSSIDQKIEAEENKKKALEELFKSLLNNLMTGKIRVNNLDLEL